MKIDKPLTLQRNYDSLSMARIDATQFVNDPEAIAGGLPKPAQWKVQVLVLRATVTPAASATEPVVVQLEVVAIGEESDIDRWAQEYRTLHDNRGLSRRQEAAQFQQTLKDAQGPKTK